MNTVPNNYNRESMPNTQQSTRILTSSKTIKSTKFWGIWLPVPTFLAIISSIFWTWLILKTVGYSESPIEKAGEWIVEEF